MHCLNRFASLCATADVRLIGDDNQKKVCRLQPRATRCDIVVEFEIFGAIRRKRLTVSDHGHIKHSVAIQENGASCYFMLSHFVSPILRVGCEIHKCHTTAWNASVCGVMFAGLTVGMTIAMSATCAVYPPSRPRIPRIALPRSFASRSALTKFGLTFFSRLPPPTDNTRIASFPLSRLPLSHSAKTEGHPSSLVRAVSSETLSVGA